MTGPDRPHPTPTRADALPGSTRAAAADEPDLFVVDTTDLTDLHRRAPWLFTPATNATRTTEGQTDDHDQNKPRDPRDQRPRC